MSMDSVMPISPRCPTCGTIMRLTGYSPTCESVVYDYICGGDGDRVSWRPRSATSSTRLNRLRALPSTPASQGRRGDFAAYRKNVRAAVMHRVAVQEVP